MFKRGFKGFQGFRCAGSAPVPAGRGGKKKKGGAGMINIIGVALHGIGFAMLLYSFAIIFFF